MKKREVNPTLYKPPIGYYNIVPVPQETVFDGVFTEKDIGRMRPFFKEKLADQPDVMTTEQVAAFTGYTKGSVCTWCRNERLRCFNIRHKNMKKKDLEAAANVSNYTVGKLNQGKNVNVDVLVRICVALECTMDDIMEIIPDEQR